MATLLGIFAVITGIIVFINGMMFTIVVDRDEEKHIFQKWKDELEDSQGAFTFGKVAMMSFYFIVTTAAAISWVLFKLRKFKENPERNLE